MPEAGIKTPAAVRISIITGDERSGEKPNESAKTLTPKNVHNPPAIRLIVFSWVDMKLLMRLRVAKSIFIPFVPVCLHLLTVTLPLLFLVYLL